MSHWTGLPTLRWLTDYRSEDEITQELRIKLGVKNESNNALKEALQKNASLVYKMSWKQPNEIQWCPQCKDNGGGLIDSMKPKDERY